MTRVEGRLRAAGCVAAAEEARLLAAAASDPGELERLVRRREDGEPLAWIVGSTWFGGREVRCARGVYVPRPQTEELARRAAAVLPPTGVAADLCTGTGAVAVHLAAARPGASVVGVDIAPAAAVVARRNGVSAVVGDLGASLRSGAFDVVTAVAPYVPTAELALLPSDVRRHEPRRALDGGPDGLALVRRTVSDAARLLRTGGWLLAEVGDDQDVALMPHLHATGFVEVEPWHDAEGDLRGLAARR